MAIKIKFDAAGNPLPARLILATRAGNRIREIPMNDVKFREGINSGSEFSFTVYKKRCLNRAGEVDESFWRRITDLKLAYCPEFDMWYELAVDLSESTATVKSATATSLGEAELSQVNVYGLEINTEDDIARDDYAPTVLYNPEDAKSSLIDRLLYKVPHYRIDHVDESIRSIQRMFQFDGTTVYDSFQEVAQEMDVLFKFDCVKGEDGKVDRTVSAYDLENSCMSCGNRGDFIGVCPECGSEAIRSGYGKDTSIYVSRENLADEITYTTDIGSAKNCFRLEGGDDLMTATIMNCNPNGSQYIWYVTDEMREDMSDELRTRLEQYDAQYEIFQNSASWTPLPALQDSYNKIAIKYQDFDSDIQTVPPGVTMTGETLNYPAGRALIGYPALMTAYYNTIDLQLFLNSGLMPNVEIQTTDAATEAAKITSASLSPVAVANLSACTAETAANAALSMVKCMIRADFQAKVKDSTYSAENHRWTGSFTVTNYGDEEDTADTAEVTVTINDDMQTYINQKIKRLTKTKSTDVTDIKALFELELPEFTAQLGNWSLQSLLGFRDACQAILDILIQQGIADHNTWVSQENDLYQLMYVPYLNKMSAIEAEVQERTEELAIVTGVRDQNGGTLYIGMQSEILAWRNQVQEAQDFEKYLGEELWNEFAAYRREDSYSNPNYISDGLSNDELFANALRFLDIAKKEIHVSATMQHSISAKMHNLLAMKEFRPLVNEFATGNWIRVAVDRNVYRLRLAEYQITYNNLGLDVEFTDVKYGHSSASDIESLLSQAKSMASSYGAVTRQAEDGKKSYSRMQNWAQEGFSLTTKIVGGAENQEFQMDSSGFTGREYLPETDSYSDEQIKIISSGVYVTDDGWLTSKAAIGKFRFWNPQTQQTEEAYGVIADTLVGNMMLSQNVGIYNESGSITLDDDGFTLITEAGEGAKVFRIIRREPDGSLVNVLSLDGTGHLVLETSGIADAVQTAVEISNRGIMTQVENRLSEVSTTMTQREDNLAIQVNQNREDIGLVQTTFRVTADGAEISKNISDTVLKLENDQIVLEVDGQPVTYWNVNEQYMPKMVNIPVGGSLRLGQIQFQPRSSGNLSLLWVGDS